MILLLEIINFQFRLFNLYTSMLYLVLYMKFIIYEELGSRIKIIVFYEL